MLMVTKHCDGRDTRILAGEVDIETIRAKRTGIENESN